LTTNPGFADQSRKRTTARLIGFGLLAVGLPIAIKGGYEFVRVATGDTLDPSSSGFGDILMLGLGGFLVVFGMAALNAGYLGATARYAAGETMPVMKDSAAYLTDGGHRTSGPFCTRCGVRNDEAAKFCDACGHTIG